MISNGRNCKTKSFYQTHGLWQTLVQLLWKLDAIGVLLLTVSTGCILVPLTVAGGVSSQRQNHCSVCAWLRAGPILRFLGE